MFRKKNHCFLVFIIFFSCFQSVYAFNWKKCRGVAMRFDNLGPIWATTSYLSSTSECSMIGMNEHDKKVYLVINSGQLLKESAMGRGEYIEGYASLSGCKNEVNKYFSAMIKNNYKKIWRSDSKNAEERAYLEINKIMNNDFILSNSCLYKG